MSTRDPSPEHVASRTIMDTLAKAAKMPSGQVLIQHLQSLDPKGEQIKFIGEAISTTIPKAAEPEAKPAPAPEAGSVGAEVV